MKSGEVFILDATGSSDPDGDNLSYLWFNYPEASSWKQPVAILGSPNTCHVKVQAPKVEKKLPTVLTGAEVEAFLQQTQGRTLKKLRDRAMLELLCATGLRVSEIIDLKVTDINLVIGYVNCSDGERERAIPFGRAAQDALRVYLEEGRAQLMKNGESDLLFVNISGSALSDGHAVDADDAGAFGSVRHPRVCQLHQCRFRRGRPFIPRTQTLRRSCVQGHRDRNSPGTAEAEDNTRKQIIRPGGPGPMAPVRTGLLLP